MYKLFDSCKLDKGWKKIEKHYVNEFKSIEDNARIKIEVKGIEPEAYIFKKDSVINIANSMIRYQDQDLVQQT
ncbi:MAG: hypothetical protein ACE5RT_03895 [Nitrosopumilaceae archaeon]